LGNKEGGKRRVTSRNLRYFRERKKWVRGNRWARGWGYLGSLKCAVVILEKKERGISIREI